MLQDLLFTYSLPLFLVGLQLKIYVQLVRNGSMSKHNQAKLVLVNSCQVGYSTGFQLSLNTEYPCKDGMPYPVLLLFLSLCYQTN